MILVPSSDRVAILVHGVLDVLIANAWVVDGSGSDGFHGAIGIEDDIVRVLRGDISHVEACRTIDAGGRVACPGFIDMHAHSGLVMLAEPAHEPKVRQGVTTEVIGVDGNSYAPFRASGHGLPGAHILCHSCQP